MRQPSETKNGRKTNQGAGSKPAPVAHFSILALFQDTRNESRTAAESANKALETQSTDLKYSQLNGGRT